MKVLFIGGDREIVQMSGRILRRSGYDVTEAVGQTQAQALLGTAGFDLVILDCDMRSDACAGLIQAVKTPPAAKLLLISPDRADEVPLLNAGADDWMRKPWQTDVLLARMAALLRQKKEEGL